MVVLKVKNSILPILKKKKTVKVRYYLCTKNMLFFFSLQPCSPTMQRIKFMYMSDSLGLVDFAVGLVDFILHLPDRQVKVLGGFFFYEICMLTCDNFLGW